MPPLKGVDGQREQLAHRAGVADDRHPERSGAQTDDRTVPRAELVEHRPRIGHQRRRRSPGCCRLGGRGSGRPRSCRPPRAGRPRSARRARGAGTTPRPRARRSRRRRCGLPTPAGDPSGRYRCRRSSRSRQLATTTRTAATRSCSSANRRDGRELRVAITLARVPQRHMAEPVLGDAAAVHDERSDRRGVRADRPHVHQVVAEPIDDAQQPIERLVDEDPSGVGAQQHQDLTRPTTTRRTNRAPPHEQPRTPTS